MKAENEERRAGWVLNEGEVISGSRKIFRESLIVNLFGVLTPEDISVFESWFINQSLKSYRRSCRRNWLGSRAKLLNYSILMAMEKMYCDAYVVASETLEEWHKNRSSLILRGIELEAEKAQQLIQDEPHKLVELDNFCRKVEKTYDLSAGRLIRSMAEKIGELAGDGVMVLGVTSGAVGYVVGKTVRRLTKGFEG